MKHPLSLLTLATGMALAATALTATAQTAAPANAAPTAKVAVIAFQAAVAQTNEFQRNYADLQKKYDPKRQQLKAQSDAIDSMTKQLNAQGATLSDAERTSRAAAIDAKKKQLERDAEDAQNDFQQEMQDMFKGVASKVYDVLAAYAQKQGYTLVLDASEQQNPVLYAVDSVNITKPVLDAYNQKSGVPAPPPEAPAAPARPAGASRPAAH